MATPRPDAQADRRAGFHRLALALLCCLVALASIGAAFWLVVDRTVDLEMDTHPPVRVVAAIPFALSELYFHHPKRYTALVSVQERFFGALPDRAVGAREYNRAIRRVADITAEQLGTEYILVGPDDKGIIDLTRWGFQVFGYEVESVTTMYYTLMLASCLLFVLAFWRSPSALLLIAAFLTMLYLAMPSVRYNAQLTSLLTLRVMPVLSMMACLHVVLFMVGSLSRRPAGWQFGVMTLQVALITFVIHVRTPNVWQVATILAGAAAVLLAAAGAN
jgi:hypothetical protein